MPLDGREVETFYQGLTKAQREELLQCILIGSTVSRERLRGDCALYISVERDLKGL